ncbi:dienelactone hydrolase [Sphingobacterium sp. CZ-UAM]|uniref:dienelactone hydrolase family protein n=1 Tax=Sphingobacterium sp. CZ-UAM TaxID=1933868 RepID=UPI000986652C|nr:dienelactone hydrolase family protein [Sphingobacterium sp. CZ-UAM]OOG20208.1 dienelactone hydrolase [Sphingobacterium sp. CZ-UAM]
MKTALTFFLLTMVTMGMKAQELKQVSYKDGTQQLNGLITSNANKKGPAVLILPAWKGIDNEAKQAALQLEKEGYIAFIADIYGEGNIPTDNTAASKIAGHYKADYKAYQQRIAAALKQLKEAGADPEKIAVIGYCFGGTGALETARAGFPVAGVVSIHGGLSKSADRTNAAINVKVLVEHPAADKSVSKEDYDGLVKELNEGKADWQIITYANSGHTFTNPESPEYNPIMAKRAWEHTLLFLKEVLN